MKTRRHGVRAICLLFFVMCSLMIVNAQDGVCPAIVSDALAQVDSLCGETGRNQACYGNVTLTAEAQAGVDDLVFDAPGDMVNVADVQSLMLSPMDEESGEWGISLMQLQANLPETLPGQNVTMVLFGDVEITNHVPPLTELPFTVSKQINVRDAPSTDSQVVGNIRPGGTNFANGRTADGQWLRFPHNYYQMESLNNQLRWVYAPIVNLEGDINTLNVVDPGAPMYQPMQAFYFRSGVGDAPCAEAPASGLLIQTPQGVGKVNLSVNEVNIELGSTAFLQAQTGGEMYVSILEGAAAVSADGITRIVPEGTSVTVPIDANGAASGPPGEPAPYDESGLQVLPLGVLPNAVPVAPPLSVNEITSVVESAAAEGDPVEALMADKQCVVTALGQTRTRTGPGTHYSFDFGVDFAEGDSALVTQQADGIYGDHWWQLANGFWVRDDTVNETGPCESVPVVTIADLPPTPTPQPIVPFYQINECRTHDSMNNSLPFDQVMSAGREVQFLLSCGCDWDTFDDALATLGANSSSITLDGVPLNAESRVIEAPAQYAPDPENPDICAYTGAPWIVKRGTHTVSGSWGPYSGTCTFVVP